MIMVDQNKEFCFDIFAAAFTQSLAILKNSPIIVLLL